MQRKRIGIVGWLNDDNMFGIGGKYLEYFSLLGDVEIIGHTEENIRSLDLLVVPGGPDVDVNRYTEDGDYISLFTGKPCIYRERFDKVLLPKYIENKTPIVGICRGHQTIAVHFGSKLIQHIWPDKHELNGRDRTELVHDILIDGRTKIGVNSIHHQVVDPNTVKGVVTAVYTKKKFTGEIESISYANLGYPIHTFQWHPEEIYDYYSKSIIDQLLNGTYL